MQRESSETSKRRAISGHGGEAGGEQAVSQGQSSFSIKAATWPVQL